MEKHRIKGSAGRKIDLLMKLTGTRNAVLGSALSFDASYISRIRNGRRSTPSDPEFAEKTAAFFAQRITESHQRAAASDALDLGCEWPNDAGDAQAVLKAWLLDEPLSTLRSSMSQVRTVPSRGSLGKSSKAEIYFGKDGKRSAVETFLSELDSHPAGTLLLYSDEDMDWITDEPGFVMTLNSFLEKLISSGWRIRIIHNLSRDRTEMWEGVSQWLPVYLRGGVEPFYCPRLRDALTTRSLFVAEGISALLSSRVTGQSGDGMCILIRDSEAVAAAADEFGAYLAQCRPLMDIRTALSAKDLAESVRSFTENAHDFMFLRHSEAGVLIKLPADSSGRFHGGVMFVRAKEPLRSYTFSELRLVEAMIEYASGIDGILRGHEALKAAERFAEELENC